MRKAVIYICSIALVLTLFARCNAGLTLGDRGCEDVGCEGENIECKISRRGSTCACKLGYFEKDGSCVSRDCNENPELCAENSSCVERTIGDRSVYKCICDQGFYYSRGECVQRTALQSTGDRRRNNRRRP